MRNPSAATMAWLELSPSMMSMMLKALVMPTTQSAVRAAAR